MSNSTTNTLRDQIAHRIAAAINQVPNGRTLDVAAQNAADDILQLISASLKTSGTKVSPTRFTAAVEALCMNRFGVPTNDKGVNQHCIAALQRGVTAVLCAAIPEIEL